MLRILKVLALVLVAAAISTSPASAQCAALSQVFGHGLGGLLVNCDDRGPVAGFAYALTPTLPTSGTSNIVCEADGEASQGATGCAGSGMNGDGIVLVDGNWGSPGVTGCPNQSSTPGVGRNVGIVRDNSGGTVVLSVGFQGDLAGYFFEFAHKADPLGNPLSVSCRTPDLLRSASECVTVSGVSRSGDATTTTATATVQALAVPVLTDCASDSYGIATGLGTCTEGSLAFARGPVYTRVGMCDASDLDLRRTIPSPGTPWTAETTDAGGSASISRSYPSDRCLFVGTSLLAGGVEGPGVVCASAIAGNLAASPRALAVRAKQDKGDVLIEFRTDTEVGLNGFEIETKGGRKVGEFISPQGIGGAGASYAVRVKRGDFRSERELYVVSVTADARLKSDLASF